METDEGSSEGKCNVENSFSKAVWPRVCKARRIMYCLLNLVEFRSGNFSR